MNKLRSAFQIRSSFCNAEFSCGEVLKCGAAAPLSSALRTLSVRRTFKSIHYRRAEPPTGNSFRNYEVETEYIELAQVTK